MNKWYFLSDREQKIYKKTLKKRNWKNKENTFTKLWVDFWISRQRAEQVFKEVEKRIKRIKLNLLTQKQKWKIK